MTSIYKFHSIQVAIWLLFILFFGLLLLLMFFLFSVSYQYSCSILIAFAFTNDVWFFDWLMRGKTNWLHLNGSLNETEKCSNRFNWVIWIDFLLSFYFSFFSSCPTEKSNNSEKKTFERNKIKVKLTRDKSKRKKKSEHWNWTFVLIEIENVEYSIRIFVHFLLFFPSSYIHLEIKYV